MGRHPLSASERRGIIVVAVIALLIILAGLLTSRCSSPSTSPSPAEIRELSAGDSIEREKRLSGEGKPLKEKGDSTKKKRKGKRNDRERKTYPTRDILNEPAKYDVNR